MEIRTAININCSPEQVWRTLTAFDKYPSWNPFIKSLEGVPVEGGKIKVSITPPSSSGMTFKPTVLKYAEGRELRWKGSLGISGLFDGEHFFVLEKNDDGSTRLIHGEKFSGILVKVLSLFLGNTKEGFEQMNAALKKECEKN